MYEAFYGLDEKPFSIPPDPSYLYLSDKHKKALSRLQYSIMNRASFTVITGDIGSGKTTLIRELIHQFDQDVSVGLVSNVNFSSFEELLQWVLYAFELEYDSKDKVSLFETFTDFVIKNYSESRNTVLIIDEAQNLTVDTLEQLRMLSNINVGQHQVLQLILVGQPGLQEMLQRPELEQFAQRIEVEYYLQPLDLEETRCYIEHRIRVAGGSNDLFTPETFSLIWQSTSGVPRLINVLCGMALVYAFADFKDQVDVEVIKHVLEDKKNNFSPISEGRKISLVSSNGHDSESEVPDAGSLSTIEKFFLHNK